MRMPAAGTLARPQDQGGANPETDKKVNNLPFVVGARGIRQRFHDRTDTLTANNQQVGPVDVLGRGFIRNIVLEVELTNGDHSTSSAAFGDDGIFGVLAQVVLTDPGGTTLVRTTGFEQYLVNKYLSVGSLATLHDPKLSPFYDDSDEGNGNGSFKLRIPVEISARDALGSLVNRSASATFKLEYSLAPSGTAFDTAPDTTLPDVRVKASLEYWDPPKAVTFDGRPAASEPPSLATAQFISTIPYSGITAGNQKIKLSRTGNLVRALIATFRTTAPARDTAGLPDDIALTYDGHDIDRASLTLVRSDIAERLGFDAAEDAAGGLDAGVVVYQFDDDLDGVPGNSMRSPLLPTTTGTDLRIEGDFDAAGTLHVTTVEVAPAGPIFG